MRLISGFWQECVLVVDPRAFYGTLLNTRRSVTQGGQLLPTIFNTYCLILRGRWAVGGTQARAPTPRIQPTDRPL